MQTFNDNQNSRSDNTGWRLLEEFSLSEFLSSYDRRGEFRAGLLFREDRELGMPPEWVEKIERALEEFAKEALAQFKQGALDTPGRIRIFCQKKSIDIANLAHAFSHPSEKEQAMEHVQKVLDSSMKTMGGWGFYVIERGRDFIYAPYEKSYPIIELYVYTEGN